MTSTAINMTSLVRDAKTELHMRQRGREARLARLTVAGVPTTYPELQAWLGHQLDVEHEAAGGVFHACTVRASNGCDSDLPRRGHYGCRITRVPISARMIEAGHVWDGEEPVDHPYWLVTYATAGVGYMAPGNISLDQAETAEQAEDIVRDSLLSRGDCYRTRAEAEAAVAVMLAARAS